MRIRAASLNYRDLAILVQKYLPTLPLPYVPASDACGEVVEVGEEVTRFKVGDRVTPIYTQGWHDGLPTLELRTRRTLGAPLSGVLQEYIAVPAEDAVSVPAHLSDGEAATLPIAALTAWSTLQEGGIKSGDTVLVQGTGGVSLFALQFARLAGARVIALSSSDEKLARAKQLGADVGINYRTTPDWNVAVKDATQGKGVEIVVETAGATLDKSLASLAFGGFIGIVGFVAGYKAEIPMRAVHRTDDPGAGHCRRFARALRGDEPRHRAAQTEAGCRFDLSRWRKRRMRSGTWSRAGTSARSW